MAILDDLKISGKNSISWFKNNVNKLLNNRNLRSIKRSDLMRDSDYLTNNLEMGKMYHPFHSKQKNQCLYP